MGCHCGEPEPYCVHRKQEAKKTRTFPNGEIPPFLPQPSDEFAKAEGKEISSELGPWAFGRVMWTPNANVIGIRPVVDRYTITRYGMKDWRKKNQEVLDMAFNTDQQLSRLKTNVKCTIDSLVAKADKHQSQNTSRLEERLKLVRDCKEEIEQLVKDLREEIVLLSEAKIKLKYALPGLNMPELIAGECIERRTNRLEQDLINDEVEIELVKELSLIGDTRSRYESVIKEIEKQMLANKACKNQLELTWSDKKETCELESINVCLRNNSPIISYYGGAARCPDNQSSPESWGIYNVTLINIAKEEIEKSRALRETTDQKLLINAIQDLRTQADKVYNALQKRIQETDQCRQMFERELQDVLRQITDAESQYDSLLKLQRQFQYNTKVVQTRLNNRLQRLRVENCRDEAQYGLLDEVEFLNSGQGDLKKQIEEIDSTVSSLYKVRSNLEYAIRTKRRSLYIDQERCMAYREKYPDAVTLSGGNS